MKGKKGLFVTVLLSGLFVYSGVWAADVAIPGTGDGVDVLKAVGVAFTKEKGIKVLVPKSIGSGGAVKVVGADKAVLGRVARAIKEKEQHFGLSYTPIFKVSTVICVNSGVTVNNLTEQQVVDIFTGKIHNWSAVGGKDEAIVVIRREEGDSSLSNLKRTFPGFKGLVFAENSTLAEKTYIMVAQVVNRPGSIGFGPFDVVFANNLKPLAINNKKPTDKDYPYFGTIGLVYKDSNLDSASREFMEFAASSAANAAIIKAGGRPLK